MKVISPERIVQVANDLLPPLTNETRVTIRHRQTVMVGLVMEMSSPMPSDLHLSKLLDCSHTKVPVLAKHWADMPWRDRYGWLLLAEGRLAHETHTVDAALL